MLDYETAAYAEYLTGDKASLVRCEKAYRFCNIGGLTYNTEGSFLG